MISLHQLIDFKDFLNLVERSLFLLKLIHHKLHFDHNIVGNYQIDFSSFFNSSKSKPISENKSHSCK